MREKCVLFGSTGSVGRQTVDVLLRMKDRFELCAIAGFSNLELLAEQAVKLECRTVLTAQEGRKAELQKLLPAGYRASDGMEELCIQAERPDVSKVLFSIAGMPAFRPFFAALNAGKKIALATKEVLVAGGCLADSVRKKTKAMLLPVDSEHSAVFQSLQGGGEIKRILLTCSGGPFRDLTPEELEKVTPDDALRHPVWNMGKKITIDSASLMNKTLEMIEAKHLFQVPFEKIQVLIHPQSIVHSMVEFMDGCVISQMGVPDMRFPVQYALTWPERIFTDLPALDFTKIQPLTFRDPDTKRFPNLLFAEEVIRNGDASGTLLNAANDVGVSRFLNREIPLPGITRLVRKVMDSFPGAVCRCQEEILSLDAEARKLAARIPASTLQPIKDV